MEVKLIAVATTVQLQDVKGVFKNKKGLHKAFTQCLNV